MYIMPLLYYIYSVDDMHTHIHMCVCVYVCITLHGQIKGKAGIHLTYYSENRDTFEIYPGKVMHMIGG